MASMHGHLRSVSPGAVAVPVHQASVEHRQAQPQRSRRRRQPRQLIRFRISFATFAVATVGGNGCRARELSLLITQQRRVSGMFQPCLAEPTAKTSYKGVACDVAPFGLKHVWNIW